MSLTSDLDKMEEVLELGPFPEDVPSPGHWLKDWEQTKKEAALNRWLEIEECLDSLVMDVQHRCYPEHSDTGVRGLMLLVRRHLWKVEQLLLEEANDSRV